MSLGVFVKILTSLRHSRRPWSVPGGSWGGGWWMWALGESSGASGLFFWGTWASLGSPWRVLEIPGGPARVSRRSWEAQGVSWGPRGGGPARARDATKCFRQLQKSSKNKKNEYPYDLPTTMNITNAWANLEKDRTLGLCPDRYAKRKSLYYQLRGSEGGSNLVCGLSGPTSRPLWGAIIVIL